MSNVFCLLWHKGINDTSLYLASSINSSLDLAVSSDLAGSEEHPQTVCCVCIEPAVISLACVDVQYVFVYGLFTFTAGSGDKGSDPLDHGHPLRPLC